MTMIRSITAGALLSGGLLTVSCATSPGDPPVAVAGPAVVQAGAPGAASRPAGATQRPTSAARHTAADARFMRDMMVHHQQALVMTALVADRTQGADIRLLAERIEASQDDELRLMRRWLESRNEPVADAHAHHTRSHAHMPGMLSDAEIARLRSARGAEFERLFLEFMIRHHEGALVMVEQLLATDGAGQEPEIFQFATHVDADQRMEIARMRRMLQAGR